MNSSFESISDINDKNSNNDNNSLKIKKLFTKRVAPYSGTGRLDQFRVIWKDLECIISQKSFGREDKVVLKGVSGYFNSRQITAIMGPSGCGKSTLLGCIAGLKRNRMRGSITISTNIQVKFAFIVQQNDILKRLTIRESLMFASKLKNESSADHSGIVNQVIGNLLLETCADVWPDKCSGGQLKRVMIGLELVSRPNILILDEPTSGLDSVTTWQLINTLIELTRQPEPVSILLTIHQPSARLFDLFNSIYLLSRDGQCIYTGPPQKMLTGFAEFGLHCPQFTNPADFALEVAVGDHGSAKIFTLATIMKIDSLEWPEYEFRINVNHNYNTSSDIWYLSHRSFRLMVQDPITVARIMAYIMGGLLVSIMFGSDSGVLGGCDYEFLTVNENHNNLLQQALEIVRDIYENYSLMGFICFGTWFFGVFSVLLVIPDELNVFLKEYRNGYYSWFSYYMSKVLTDLPLTILLPNLSSIPEYYLTGQYSAQMWRPIHFSLILILLTLDSSAFGFLIGVALVEYPSAVIYVGIMSMVPIVLLSGMMIRVDLMPALIRHLSYGNYMRFGMSAIMTVIYGHNRCESAYIESNVKLDITSMLTDDQMFAIYSSDKINAKALVKAFDFAGMTEEGHKSPVQKLLDLNDSDYYFSIFMLLISFVVLRILGYLIMLRKLKTMG